ncbi:hypothetical protein [Clostridium butyricum]|uniref:hypothetical protein n=1 Tax=Clostridium butyricum TaxID=1492 RepID=UPI001969EA48|nr:hypothetical protein [Clostridium butyricum]MCQ2022251.1 hypothetical protein [Clostridium butyricum]
MISEKIEVIKDAYDYLKSLKKGIVDCVNCIQEGNEVEAMKLIPLIADGIDWIINVVRVTKDAQKNELDIYKINSHLEEMIYAMENEDYILVGDLFNYEILPILNEIEEEFKLILEN